MRTHPWDRPSARLDQRRRGRGEREREVCELGWVSHRPPRSIATCGGTVAGTAPTVNAARPPVPSGSRFKPEACPDQPDTEMPDLSRSTPNHPPPLFDQPPALFLLPSASALCPLLLPLALCPLPSAPTRKRPPTLSPSEAPPTEYRPPCSFVRKGLGRTAGPRYPRGGSRAASGSCRTLVRDNDSAVASHVKGQLDPVVHSEWPTGSQFTSNEKRQGWIRDEACQSCRVGTAHHFAGLAQTTELYEDGRRTSSDLRPLLVSDSCRELSSITPACMARCCRLGDCSGLERDVARRGFELPEVSG
jgi:hypothetical protein